MLRIERLSPTPRSCCGCSPPAAGSTTRCSPSASRHGPARCATRCARRSPHSSSWSTSEGRYAFRHALLREVVADDLLPGERAELHLALARALEARAAGLPAHGGAHLAAGIAHHYSPPAISRPRWRPASVRAGAGRRAVHANGEAAALYSRALQLWDRVRRRAASWPGSTTSSCCARPRWPRAASTSPPAPSRCCAPRWPSSARRPTRSAAAVLLERIAREQFNQGHSADGGPRRAGARSTLLPRGPSEARARLLAERGQGADARVALRGGGGRGRARRSTWRAPSATRSSELRALDGMGSSLFGLGRYEEGERALREALRSGARAAAG